MGSRQSDTCLIELGTEELPPKSLKSLSLAFADLLSKALESTGLPPDSVQVFATPRRLALLLHNVPIRQPERSIENIELFRWFDVCESQCRTLIENQLSLPAYEQVMKASHVFNLLDARHAISVTERQRFILRVRTLSRTVAQTYLKSREALGFPLLSKGLKGG